MSKPRTYEGENIDITFDMKKCIHAEECVHGLPGVFDAEGRPWVNPDGGTAEEVMAVVGRCPTGALTARRHDGGADETPDANCSVRVVPDGPVHVRGEMTVSLPGEDAPVVDHRAAFCRCGQSAIKPYCDNAHIDAGFSAGDLAEMPERAVPEAPGPEPVEVMPAENGPLLLRGTVKFTDASGVEGWITNPALCRCGLSQTKPFCDGAHKDGAFISPGGG